MSTTATIRLYEMLKPKLGDQEARMFIQHFEESFDEQFTSKSNELATRSDLKLEVSELRGELRIEIAQSKVDLIKWMVGFWIAQMAAIVGLYLTK